MGALSLGWFVKISVLEIYLTLWSTLSDYFLPPEGVVQASLTIIIIVIIIIIYNEQDIIIIIIIIFIAIISFLQREPFKPVWFHREGEENGEEGVAR